MNSRSTLRASAPRQALYICRPCLRRQLHAARTLRDVPKLSDPPKRKSPIRRPRKDVVPGVPLSLFKPYTKKELAALRKKYTPAQMAAIKAGEAAVDPKDLAEQPRFRTNDPWAITYNEDFATIDPVLDKSVKAPKENRDSTLRFKSEEEVKADFADFVSGLPDPENVTGLEYQEFMDRYRLMVGKESAERNPISYMAPAIPKDVPGLTETATKKEGAEEVSPALKRLVKQTGFSVQEIRRFRIKILVQHRVVNQTRMGKIQSIYYLTIAGNQKGLLGIGEGKSTEADDARQQAQHAAIRNLQPIPMYEARTIYGDVKGKVGAVELELMNRPPGFGIRCQHLIYEMCRCAGISDLAARVTRSRNPMNTVKATFQALMSQRIPDEIARGLGRKLVDARKVYYGGNV